ncbi:bifunctional nicotinamide-nucleotide adenylyltransferase/Nudix hydroxylase [Extensimonas perlucida]|uniref:bifunctional nicotinamide-nucleotide adenylyltransferase/Nudix hydroxylase n=1 Tax=Extensimonas perlucida TaxID=2590786 RepID=UPI0011A0A300|nr:bifunctional nicotinamide-nucleotide adenylyltransferase/Nudix hydroxylase [Extensimonas perlucida]
MTTACDTAIYIGRFEPVHHAHLALLRQALASARQVIVVIGSAWQARSPRNPFTWQERAGMLRQALPEAERARLQLLPVRDYYDEPVWAQAVRRGVAALTTPGARIALVGHFKDATSNYLRSFPGWELISLPRQGDIDASTLRDAYLGAATAAQASAAPNAALHAQTGADLATDPAANLAAIDAALLPWKEHIPPATLAFLRDFAQKPEYAALQHEWHVLRDYRASWAGAPYPPVFVTVDAVLRCQEHVLVIRRAHAPGKGQLAVPGGFIEQKETLWQSCLRELAEETHCALPEAALRAALRQVQVFDHPERSQRGRTITHAHYFDLGNAPFPAVQADDDALQAQWLPIAALAGMEDQFFEDHFHILDRFLQLTDAAELARGV